jgi:hypothetical protein
MFRVFFSFDRVSRLFYFSFYWMVCVFYSFSILYFSTVQTLQLRVVFVIHCLENFIYLRGSKNFLISVVVFYFLKKKD